MTTAAPRDHTDPYHDGHEGRHDHDRGLGFDVATLMSRRYALTLLAGVGATTLVGCSVGGSSSGTTPSATASTAAASTTSSATSTATASASATVSSAVCAADIPEETAGPYPGDGSNGPNVLVETGIVRSDIRSSYGSATGVAEGVPLTINLTIQDRAAGCAPLAGAAVYLWHCNRDGEYSLYGREIANENYLRGVQEADANGTVTFTSIFPAAYDGRWPHIHFEVYASLSDATEAGKISATSQVALPEEVCALVYATEGYETSLGNLSRTTLESDNVFGDDGGARQLATVTGDVTAGFVASLAVPV